MTEKIIIPNAPFVSDLMADFVNGENLKILKNLLLRKAIDWDQKNLKPILKALKKNLLIL